LQSARAKLGARRDKNNRQQGLTEEQKQEIRFVILHTFNIPFRYLAQLERVLRSDCPSSSSHADDLWPLANSLALVCMFLLIDDP
jgi:hypothetical protein